MRKKIYLISFLMLLLTSCETYISLEELSPESVLWVGGYVSTADSVHTVGVVMIERSEFRAVSVARLQAFVNGRLVDDTASLSEGHKSYKIKNLTFKADINPGDELRLVIDADNQHVEMRSKAPEAAPIISVDTSTVIRYDEKYNSHDCRQYGIRVKDRPGETNYFRVAAFYDYKNVVEEITGHPWNEDELYPGKVLEVRTAELDLDNTMEPLLYKGVPSIGSEEPYNYFENKYNIFTDVGFKDGEYTLRLFSDKQAEHTYLSGSGDFKMRVFRKIRVQLQSLDRDSYNYIDMASFQESDQSSYYFGSTIPCPDNVDGGIGFVSLMSVNEYVINLTDIVGFPAIFSYEK